MFETPVYNFQQIIQIWSEYTYFQTTDIYMIIDLHNS